MSQPDPILSTKDPLVKQANKQFLTLEVSIITKAIILFIFSVIYFFIIYNNKVHWSIIIIDILFAILTLIYFLLPYGIKVCVDNVNRIISINKVCILYCVYFCCPKKYKIDEIQEFSYEVVEINDDSKEQHLCVNFKDGRGKEIFYKCRTSYFCCFRYDAPIQEVHQKLNSMIYSCGSQGSKLSPLLS